MLDDADVEILASYDIGSILSAEALPPPRYNKYKVTAEAGTYFLCKRGRLWPTEPMERFIFFHELVGFLADQGFPSPNLIKDRKGRTFHPIEKRVFELWEWIPGVNCVDDRWEEPELDEMMALLSEYHRLVPGFSPSAPYAEPPIEEELPARFDKLSGPLPGVIATALSRVSESFEQFAHLPRTVVHGDVASQNFHRDGKQMWLLDYEWSRIDARLWDLGNAAIAIPEVEDGVISIPVLERIQVLPVDRATCSDRAGVPSRNDACHCAEVAIEQTGSDSP